MAKPTIGVHSGLVRTVLGPIPVEAMGVTLLHEHILLDASSWWKRPCCGSEIAIAERALDISMIGDLRMNPFLNRDNCGLLDVRAAIEELSHFVEYGGRTVVDPTNLGIGRDPSALQRISRRSGLNIVMGAGFYLEPSHPPYVKDMTVEAIAEAIARDCGLSEDERRMWDRRRRGDSWELVASAIGGTPVALRQQYARAVRRVSEQLGLDDVL